jgi:hypothetical protein
MLINEDHHNGVAKTVVSNDRYYYSLDIIHHDNELTLALEVKSPISSPTISVLKQAY